MAALASASVHRGGSQAGFRYDISILQAEFSLTQVLDRPVHGRLFFEQVIHENLDLGRPNEIKHLMSFSISDENQGTTPGTTIEETQLVRLTRLWPRGCTGAACRALLPAS